MKQDFREPVPPCDIGHPGWMAPVVLGVLIASLLGCSSVKIPPPYTEQELKRECERHGGWWREDELRGGFCEYPSMM